MVEATDKFYNIKINLIKNGRIYAEDAAIRNVWEKDRSIFFDIYIHRLNKSFIFDSVFIHDIYDVSRDKFYNDIDAFVKDFYTETSTTKEQTMPKKTQSESNILSPIENDIVILLFMANTWGGCDKIKNKIIYDYIYKNVAKAQNLSQQYIDRYITGLSIELDNFYKSLKGLKAKTPKEAEYLLHEAVKICRADGHLHYAERMYLAEIIQALRNYGMSIPNNLI